ncbi:hypothetical protein LCGC14_2894200 [marine sediment metagenome]|uniref:Uncharacterized protein n=1 Tax=marine sediment metagenome TaxID=412755 RepID=A0A0F8YI55_9ZZZZ
MDQEKRLRIKAGTLITPEMLRELEACSQEVIVFRRLWPNGLSLRLKNLKLAEAAGLDVWWFAVEILSRKGRWSEYNKYGTVHVKFQSLGDDYCRSRALWEIIKKR